MEVVNVYKWFEAVWWPDRNCLIDCLVDTSVTSLNDGSYLLINGSTLQIATSDELLMLSQNSNLTVLGKVIRRDCPLSQAI